MYRISSTIDLEDKVLTRDCHATRFELMPGCDWSPHARKLIDQILVHVGDDDAEAWKVVILNDDHDGQTIVPFAVSRRLRAQRPGTRAGFRAAWLRMPWPFWFRESPDR